MCEIAGWRLIAWMDGELGESDALAIAAHVGACESCVEQVRRFRTVTSDVGEYGRAFMTPNRPKWRWTPAAAAAAVLLAAALRLMNTTAPVPPARAAGPPADHREPSILVAVPVQDLLPIGAAPPGAVVVGEFVLDAGGTPKTFRWERPQGD